MRWLLGGLAALVILVGVYLGTAVASLAGLAAAARAGDGAAVIERTDVKSLTQSIAEQVVAAYLERVGQTQQVRPTERMLVRAFGLNVADAMIAKMLTPEHLTQILKTGKLDGAEGVPAFSGVPSLAALDTGDVVSLLQRLRFVEPVELAVRLSDTTEPDGYAAIKLHFEGTAWKLSGLILPKTVVRDLAASLPVK